VTSDEKNAVIAAFVALKLLHENSMTPSQKRVAERGAANCLHALGITEFGGIVAQAPEGKTINMEPETRRLR
jgi:hypothetical protein